MKSNATGGNRQLPTSWQNPQASADRARARQLCDSTSLSTRPDDLGLHVHKLSSSPQMWHGRAAHRTSVMTFPLAGSLEPPAAAQPALMAPLPSQRVTTAPPTAGQFNAGVIGQIGLLSEAAHRTIDTMQPFGHHLSQPEIATIVRVLTDTANQVRSLAQQASKSPLLSMEAVGHIQAAMQDLYNATHMYVGMSQGEASFENQCQINQMRNNLATAQALYSTLANDSQRRVPTINPQSNPSLAAGYGPITPGSAGGPSASPMGTPPMGAPMGGSMPQMTMAVLPTPMQPPPTPYPQPMGPQSVVPTVLPTPDPEAQHGIVATPHKAAPHGHVHRTSLPVPGN